jgi:hypothetical protein
MNPATDSMAVSSKSPASPKRFAFLRARTTPGRLQLIQVLIIAATLVFAGLGLSIYAYVNQTAKVIGRDSAPSILAAQTLRSVLGDAHANLANAIVIKEAQDGDHWRAYRHDMEDAHRQLLIASQNITYGVSEREPILSVMQGIGEYERLVGEAIAQGDGDALAAADKLMRSQIEPAADALNVANFEPLNTTYSKFRRDIGTLQFVGMAYVVAMLVVLVFTQVYVFRVTRRLLNPGLLAATIVFVALAGVLVVATVHINRELRVAKQDAFDSIYVLSKARAAAYGANADVSFYLLDGGNGGDRTARLAAFKQKQQDILRGSPAEVVTAIQHKTRLGGFLGDELANITFEGEQEAAERTVQAWEDYTVVYQGLLDLDVKAAAHDPAKALGLTQTITLSDLAFGTFDNALEKTLDINENAYDEAIEQVFTSLRVVPALILFVAVFVMLATLAGLRPRINKYRF